MNKHLTAGALLILLSLTGAGASAQTSRASLELAAELSAAAEAGTPEAARLFSARTLDGAAQAPAVRLGSFPDPVLDQAAAVSAARRVSLAAQVPPPHVAPISSHKRARAVESIILAPIAIVMTPISMALAGYFLGSRGKYAEHSYGAARLRGGLFGLLGFIAGVILTPLVIVTCLRKAANAACEGRI